MTSYPLGRVTLYGGRQREYDLHEGGVNYSSGI